LPERSLAGNRVAWEVASDAWVVSWRQRGAGLLRGATQQTYEISAAVLVRMATTTAVLTGLRRSIVREYSNIGHLVILGTTFSTHRLSRVLYRRTLTSGAVNTSLKTHSTSDYVSG